MLTDFGRALRVRIDECTDELIQEIPAWSDEQRRAAERVLCLHLLAAHGQGMRDAARLVRLHPQLEPGTRNTLADAIEAALAARREWA